MTHHSGIAARPLLIGGMHRSGTSLTASLFASAGLDLGGRLLGADRGNPLGHFEDVRFLEFHRRALVAQGICTEGYTTTARGSVPPGLEPTARDIVADRMRPGVAWGWKEPRTTLFLDFWQEQLPQARHVFVFRRPWEVADSLFRRGEDAFVINPALALHVWTHYNRLILDFVRRHAANCLVFEISQVTADPAGVCAAVRSRLDIDLGRPEAKFRADLFTGDDRATHMAIVRAVAPDALRIYDELRELAGSGPAVQPAPQAETAAGDCAVIEWARASRADAEARGATRGQSESGTAGAGHPSRSRHTRLERTSAGLTRAVRRIARGVLRPIEAALKKLLSRPRAAPSGRTPELLPFPRPQDSRTGKRAA